MNRKQKVQELFEQKELLKQKLEEMRRDRFTKLNEAAIHFMPLPDARQSQPSGFEELMNSLVRSFNETNGTDFSVDFGNNEIINMTVSENNGVEFTNFNNLMQELNKAGVSTDLRESVSTTGTRFAHLLEGELEKAQLILAAKDMLDSLQKVAENLAKMQADDIIPLSDQIKTNFGTEYAVKFNEVAKARVEAAFDAVREAKDTIGSEVLKLQQVLSGIEVQTNDMADMGAESPKDSSDQDAGDELFGDTENTEEAPQAGNDTAEGGDDLFGGAEGLSGDNGEPLGRAKKESVESKSNALNEAKKEKEYIVYRTDTDGSERKAGTYMAKSEGHARSMAKKDGISKITSIKLKESKKDALAKKIAAMEAKIASKAKDSKKEEAVEESAAPLVESPKGGSLKTISPEEAQNIWAIKDPVAKREALKQLAAHFHATKDSKYFEFSKIDRMSPKDMDGWVANMLLHGDGMSMGYGRSGRKYGIGVDAHNRMESIGEANEPYGDDWLKKFEKDRDSSRDEQVFTQAGFIERGIGLWIRPNCRFMIDTNPAFEIQVHDTINGYRGEPLQYFDTPEEAVDFVNKRVAANPTGKTFSVYTYNDDPATSGPGRYSKYLASWNNGVATWTLEKSEALKDTRPVMKQIASALNQSENTHHYHDVDLEEKTVHEAADSASIVAATAAMMSGSKDPKLKNFVKQSKTQSPLGNTNDPKAKQMQDKLQKALDRDPQLKKSVEDMFEGAVKPLWLSKAEEALVCVQESIDLGMDKQEAITSAAEMFGLKVSVLSKLAGKMS